MIDTNYGHVLKANQTVRCLVTLRRVSTEFCDLFIVTYCCYNKRSWVKNSRFWVNEKRSLHYRHNLGVIKFLILVLIVQQIHKNSCMYDNSASLFKSNQCEYFHAFLIVTTVS